MTTDRSAPVLVVVPHATRTGSTRVLLDLLAQVVATREVELRLELLADGPHARELRSLAPVRRPGEPIGAAVANSSLAARGLAALPRDVPTAVYVHEPGEVLATLPDAGRRELLRATTVLCVSEAVRADVVAFGVEAGRTRTLAPLVVPRPHPGAEPVSAARSAAGTEEGGRLVVGCGEAAWRKGADLFVEVAAAVSARPDVRFAWVGRRLRPFSRQLDLDVASAGLEARMAWIDEVADVGPYLAAADVLVAPSRYDPQPLVPLEAATVGTPTVAFAVGGLAAMGAAGAARVAPFPDAPALAAHVHDLLDDAATTGAVVEAARRWTEVHHGPGVVVPGFVQALHDLLGSSVP